MTSFHAFPLFLSATVPLHIAELESQGGPTADDYAAAQTLAPDLAAHGDVMLYGGKPGEAGDLANRTARSVAVLAFSPGGVTLFGEHWEAGGQAHVPSTYYTPAAVLAIIEPQMGSGGFLAELVTNPPWKDTP